MDVYFADPQLANVCASERELKRRFGVVRAKRIGVRLQQLKIADDLADLRNVTTRVHHLSGNLSGLVALDLDGPYRLLIEPLLPADSDRSRLDWGSITEVVVVEISDYH